MLEPPVFENVLRSVPYLWQVEHWQRMLGLIHQNTVPHALLLVGQRGMGKSHFAQALSALLLCEQRGQKACGICSACQLMSAETHPDFFLIKPEAPGGLIKIDQVRSLIASLSQRALKGRYKVVMIEPLEALNIASSNALLKQLEEPFPNTIFVLISDDVSRLLPSVLSRCQRLRFYTDLTQELEHWLKNQLHNQVHPTIAELWAHYSSPFQLIEAVSSGLPEKRAQFLKKICEFQLPGVLAEYCEEMPQVELLSWMMGVVGDCIRLKCQQLPCFIDQESRQYLQKISSALNLRECYQVLQYYVLRQEDLNQQVSLNNSLFALSLLIPWAQLCSHQELTLEVL